MLIQLGDLWWLRLDRVVIESGSRRLVSAVNGLKAASMLDSA